MKVLVLPRDPNPYQRLLYGEMKRLGIRVVYIGDLTPSQTLNLMLLPLEVVLRRIAGARLIHMHWVFSFGFPCARNLLVMRQLAQFWFRVWLRTCRILGMHLVWTAHNILPHEPVFADDVSARRTLVHACDLVIAHSQSALTELAALGAVARRAAVIQHGPIAPILPGASLRTPGADGGPRRFLFFGRVQEYKGVDDLIVAFLALPDAVDAHLTVAGRCDDPKLRSRVLTLAQRGGTAVACRLGHIPEEDLAELLDAADVVVLPFRRVTTSGSAILALSYGRPLVVPDLPGLAHLPDEAVLRYQSGIPRLTAALAHMAEVSDDTFAAMSAAAAGYAFGTTWQHVAARTTIEMLSLLNKVPEPRRPNLSATAP
jgi:glycosyltransferase involved in cell wall biosynthesis